jgi:hypothetical protein
MIVRCRKLGKGGRIAVGKITTLGVAEEPNVKALLGIPPHMAVATIMPLGRPSRQPKKLCRAGCGQLLAEMERQGEEDPAPAKNAASIQSSSNIAAITSASAPNRTQSPGFNPRPASLCAAGLAVVAVEL